MCVKDYPRCRTSLGLENFGFILLGIPYSWQSSTTHHHPPPITTPPNTHAHTHRFENLVRTWHFEFWVVKNNCCIPHGYRFVQLLTHTKAECGSPLLNLSDRIAYNEKVAWPWSKINNPSTVFFAMTKKISQVCKISSLTEDVTTLDTVLLGTNRTYLAPNRETITRLNHERQSVIVELSNWHIASSDSTERKQSRSFLEVWFYYGRLKFYSKIYSVKAQLSMMVENPSLWNLIMGAMLKGCLYDSKKYCSMSQFSILSWRRLLSPNS